MKLFPSLFVAISLHVLPFESCVVEAVCACMREFVCVNCCPDCKSSNNLRSVKLCTHPAARADCFPSTFSVPPQKGACGHLHPLMSSLPLHRSPVTVSHGCYCLALLRSVPAAAYIVLVTVLRYHLFIWSVFSPKLLYESMHLLLTAAVCLFFITMEQSHSSSKSEGAKDLRH